MGIDFQHRDIAAAVGAQHFRFEFAVIGQFDSDLFGTVDDMCVGEHKAVGGDEESRALRMHHASLARPGYSLKELR